MLISVFPKWIVFTFFFFPVYISKNLYNAHVLLFSMRHAIVSFFLDFIYSLSFSKMYFTEFPAEETYNEVNEIENLDPGKNKESK